MKNIKNIIFALVVTCFTAGCGSDFLDVSDKVVISPNVFPTTMAQMDLLTTSLYTNTHSLGTYGFNWYGLGVYLYEHASDLSWIADDIRNAQASNRTLPSCSYTTQTWAGLYQGIQRCNSLLDVLPTYEKTYAKESDLATLNYMKGQALFCRAFYYWHLQIFCQLEPAGMAVPLYAKDPKTVDEMMQPRATTAEFWAFIIQDLTDAIPLLAGKTDATRATEWAAKGLLAKVYAQSGNWTLAKPALKDVIDNSGKSLAPFNTYKNMFNGDTNYEFNSESLYEIDVTNDMTSNQNRGINGSSSMPVVFAPSYVNKEGKSIGSGWSNNFVHDKNVYRFGFNLAVPTRIPNPKYDATKDITTRNMDLICTDAYVTQSRNMRTNKTVDPRLFLSCAQPFIDSMKVSGVYAYYHHFMDVPAEFQAWSHKKYTNLLGTEGEINFNSGANLHFLRLADIYLLYAEACVNSSDNTTALEYINKVKRRAYGYAVNSPSPVDYASLTDRTLAQAGDHLANDPLKYERWAEFFGEGQWWYDVRRWKIGKEESAYFEKTRVGVLSWSDNGYVQPIPQTEMERNQNLVQSPY